MNNNLVNKIISYSSPNFDERKAIIDMIILHYTDMQDVDSAIALLCDPESKVSAHYVISKKGKIYQLVDESKRAWHAGVSYWQGVTDINSCSIGIELDNPGHTYGHQPFPEPQMQALESLLADIVARYNISPTRILGHSDVAPNRKQDPGPLFDWERLEKKGLARRSALDVGHLET